MTEPRTTDEQRDLTEARYVPTAATVTELCELLDAAYNAGLGPAEDIRERHR